jgi:hypothetical protein
MILVYILQAREVLEGPMKEMQTLYGSLLPKVEKDPNACFTSWV